ncbi:MAG: hypothetical protein QM758_27750 [Armatimonas sp.]
MKTKIKSAFLICVVLLGTTSSAMAQTYDFTEGEQLKASRQFVIAETSLTAPILYQFAVSAIDTESNATLALNETVEGFDSKESTIPVTSFKLVSGPKLYDESTWYVATIISEGIELQISAVIFRSGSLVELWSVISASGSHIGSLQTIAETFAVEVPEDITDANILSTLPGMTDIPAGYYLNEELVEPGDDPA